MKFSSALFLIFACVGCAASSASKTPDSAADVKGFEPLYGVEMQQPATDETVPISGCRYGLDVQGFARMADASGADVGILEFELAGALVTVRLAVPGADLGGVTNAVYRREVNGLAAPFYGYSTSSIERGEGTRTFAFAVKNAAHPSDEGHYGVVHIREYPASGRVVVMTAVWSFEDQNEARTARIRDLADSAYLGC